MAIGVIDLIFRVQIDFPVTFRQVRHTMKTLIVRIEEVLEENRSDDDDDLLPLALERHEQKQGRRPESIAADMGFCPDAETYEELEWLFIGVVQFWLPPLFPLPSHCYPPFSGTSGRAD